MAIASMLPREAAGARGRLAAGTCRGGHLMCGFHERGTEGSTTVAELKFRATYRKYVAPLLEILGGAADFVLGEHRVD
ncbi:MAG: hypothetical protein ACRD1H_16010, partial [Vicinamibacterales bacterium]